MSEGSELRKKRGVEEDITSEGAEDSLKYADAETMARRRVVRVVRQSSNGPAPPSLSGVFKAVSSLPPPGAQVLPTKFSFSTTDANSGANNGGDGGPASAPPAAPFLFGGKPVDSGITANKKFFLDGKSECENKYSTSGSGAEVSDNSGSTKTSLFGDAFKFTNGAVNLFVDAKERLATREGSCNKEQEGMDKTEPQEELIASTALTDTDSVVLSTGDVLATIPCKLFLFKSETKKWAECGVGDAKIKRHESPVAGDDGKKFFYRLIVRDGYSLNVLLSSNFYLTSAEETHIVFALPKEGDTIATYYLKYTGQQGTTCGAEFTKVLKETLSLAKKGFLEKT